MKCYLYFETKKVDKTVKSIRDLMIDTNCCVKLWNIAIIFHTPLPFYLTQMIKDWNLYKGDCFSIVESLLVKLIRDKT